MSSTRKIVTPDEVFNVDGFTHAVVTEGNKTIYLSGQLAWDKNFQVIGEGDFVKQTAQVFTNIQHILDKLDATWDHVVKMTIYTTQPHESETIAKVKQEARSSIPCRNANRY